jgi:predicted phosphodiesterase
LRIAVLSDVHGNPTALEACLRHVERMEVDQRAFLGDAVGYLPGARECVEMLTASGFLCQQGNHESMLLEPSERAARNEAVYRLAEARSQLPEQMLSTLAAWPRSRRLEADGKRILFVHGTPDDPLEGYAYPDSDLSAWAELPFDAVFTGNTHRPFAARQGSILIANAGSVGLPRDVGDLACFLVYDSAAGNCEHYRVRFDVELALAHVDVHPATRECLHRQATRFVGQVLR